MIHIFNQVSLGASDTIRNKVLYNPSVSEMEVKIKVAIEKIALSNAFKDNIEHKHQHMNLSGVGSHVIKIHQVLI